MDPRFEKSNILKRRQMEWNPNKIVQYIEELFSCIELIDNWKFTNIYWGKETKPRVEELKKNIITPLTIVLTDPKGEIHKYDLKIPDLVFNQFFYIGGYYKIPIFQLFDFPIIYRPEKPNLIKFHNNIMTINTEYKNDEFISQVFTRNIPLTELIACAHTEAEFDNFINGLVIPVNGTVDRIYKKCKEVWKNTTTLDRIKAIGKLFSTVKNDEEKKGNSFIFSLRSAYDIDIFTKKFMNTNSILFEIIDAINKGTRSDTDILNKRIRFSEYVLSPLIKKVYDMLVTLKSATKGGDFKIPQNILVENCNISDIVRYNFSVNPVSEVAMMMQCTITGPGGFKKSNVPSHLREIHSSQYGYICPADTPDRDGCGVILNMCPTIDLDNDGRFGIKSEEIVSSYPISLTPFLSNNDQTRLQMASSQIKQSILLENSETPIIKTGSEDCFLDESTFLHRAKRNGKVVCKNDDIMIVIYDDESGEVIKLYYRTGIMDYIKPLFEEGESFNSGDILAQSKFIKNGELSLGSNLLTGIAVWKGFNYEDGIILSSSVQDKFKSIHSVDLSFEIEPNQVLLSLDSSKYLPLPEIGTTIKKGEVYARLKSIDVDGDLENINIEPIERTSPIECKIVSIEMFANTWNKNIEEHSFNIQRYINKQSKKFNEIKNKIIENLGKDKAEKFISIHNLSSDTKEGKFYFEGNKINGVLVKINAIYKEKISVGDKMANRHGNKGVCSEIAIIPEEKMPLLPDGRRLEIICNPLGIISRMNPGQLFELHLTECLYQLKETMKISTDKKARKLLKKFLEIIDKTENKWPTNKILEDFDSNLSKNGIQKAIENICIYQPSFQCISPDELIRAMEFTGAKDKYTVYDPEEKCYLENPISCGYIYFLKLIHRAAEKISYRSIGPYSQKTLQPPGGKSNHGGHRVGEMEVWSLKAYGAETFLKDLLTVQSDSSGSKNKMLADTLKNPDLINDDIEVDNKPASLKLLESNLLSIGLRMENTNV